MKLPVRTANQPRRQPTRPATANAARRVTPERVVRPGRGPDQFSRPPLARMLRLHGLIQDGRFPNCKRLAAESGSLATTVQRDIDFMRDQFELPIDYNAAERGFFYARPVVQFPGVQISEGELVALFVARRALEQYRGTAFERPLRSAFEKLTAALPEKIGFAWEDFDRAVAFHPGTHGHGVADLQVFQTVSEAVRRGEELEFDYRKPTARADAPPERRRVQPLHLGCLDNQWYLIATTSCGERRARLCSGAWIGPGTRRNVSRARRASRWTDCWRAASGCSAG